MISRTLFARIFVCLLIVSFVAATAFALEPRVPVRGNPVIHGGNFGLTKATADTIDLMGPAGSGSSYFGDFESSMNGWMPIDLTQPLEHHWQVSDYNQTAPGNLAAWCGSLAFAACTDGADLVGGYGNFWHESLELRLAVHNPLQSATVRVTGILQVDTEPDYDSTRLSATIEGQLGYTSIQIWDGKGTIAVDESFTYQPSELVGGSEVVIGFRVWSDSAYSDEDCLWPSNGACQVDDITVTVTQSGQADIVDFADFQDGTFGNWLPTIAAGVGDFASLWANLEDADPCRTNYSTQVAFIDDGIIVPGTGGQICLSWCYGPSGYIVNTKGGLAGPENHIEDSIYSPVMTWPNDDFDGIRLSFDAYVHEDLRMDSPFIFSTWSVRSADTDNSAGNGAQVITEQPFLNRGLLSYGPPRYERFMEDVSDLMVPGRDEIQVQLGVVDLGPVFGFSGDDGYPAPYFDNVSVKVFPHEGPVLLAVEEDLAQDAFPECDTLDFGDLGAMNVRFDAARNIAPDLHQRNDPGDSIVVVVKPMRAGSILVGAPEMHYTIAANPVFDDYRTMPVTGVSLGVPATVGGVVAPDRWAFDLPDTGTLFPGDVLHYYIRAGDEVAGDVKYATLPVDRTGYGEFAELRTYDFRFVVSALPSIEGNGFGGLEVPDLLVWDDGGDPEKAADLYAYLTFAGEGYGVDFDFYYTNAASDGVGNGVGGRTSGSSLAAYNTIIYTSGDNSRHTLSNGNTSFDAGDDLGALTAWLDQGSRYLFLSGDGLASDLGLDQDLPGLAFLNDVMGVDLVGSRLQTFIGNQVRPLVIASPGNPVFQREYEWFVEGGCPDIRTVDAVNTLAGASRLAEFADVNGNPGAYSFAAGTLNIHDGSDMIISLPYDHAATADPNAKVASTEDFQYGLICDVLRAFGYYSACFEPGPVPVPEFAAFSVSCYPNPFNPTTRLDYRITGPGHLTMKIFNLRGQLVRTLIDQEVQSSGYVVWDGTDSEGATVASGVYFGETRIGKDLEITKMALIK